jgi:hypothetical protein
MRIEQARDRRRQRSETVERSEIMRTVSWSWRGIVIVSAMIAGWQDAASQDADGNVHQAKQAYVDRQDWPATAPGQVHLQNFAPFRAVYERHYRDGNGEHRQDRVIITAERVAWGDRAAIMVGLIDAGNLDYTDTNARSQVRYFAADDLSLLLQLTPASGAAKDYSLIRAEEGQVHMTTVKTATGESQHRELPAAPPGFGAPGAWLFGSMALAEGMRIRFDPYYAPASSNILGAAPSRVVGREWIETPGGARYHAWVLERPLGMTSPRLMLTYVIDRPPYLLGKKPVNADTGEATEIGSLRLLEFQTFQDGRD